METNPSNRFYAIAYVIGGARPGEKDSIGPQCFIVDIIDSFTGKIVKRIMIDCGVGIAQDKEKEPHGYGPDLSLILSDGKKIDVIILTHSHLDHVGFVPALSKLDLLEVDAYICGSPQTLQVSIINWRISWKKETPHFRQHHYYDVVGRCRSVSGPGELDLGDKVSAHLIPNGHIPGSVSVVICVGDVAIAVLGDASWHDQGLVKGGWMPSRWPAELLKKRMIILGTDSTYASSDEADETKSYAEKEKDLVDAVVSEILKGHKVVVNGFANVKCPNVALAIAHAFAERGMQIPVWLDGLGKVLWGIYQEERWSDCDNTFPNLGQDSGVYEITCRRHRRALMESDGPWVCVTTDGMGMFGPVLQFYEYGLERDDFSFFSVSYLAPDSTAKKLCDLVAKYPNLEDSLQERSFSFKIKRADGSDREVNIATVRANIQRFSLSAHGTLGNQIHFMMDLIRARGGRLIEQIIPTHGTAMGLERAAREFTRFTNHHPVIPGRPGMVVEIAHSSLAA